MLFYMIHYLVLPRLLYYVDCDILYDIILWQPVEGATASRGIESCEEKAFCKSKLRLCLVED